MTFGIAAYNPGNDFVLSERAPTLHHLGRATYQGTGAMPGTVASSGIAGHRYTVYAPNGSPMPIVRFTPGNSVWVETPVIIDNGGGNWTLWIRTNASPGAVEIHCFGKLADGTSPASPWGERILGPNGEVCFDSTRKPLGIYAIATFTARSDLFPYLSSGNAFDTYPLAMPSSNVGLVCYSAGYASGSGGQIGGLAKATATALLSNAVARVVGGKIGGNFEEGPSNNCSLLASSVLVVDLTPYL